MRRCLLTAIGVMVMTLLTAGEAKAALITQCDGSLAGCDRIGTFIWGDEVDSDGLRLGEVFTLLNATTDDFTSVTLFLDGAPFVDFPGDVSALVGASDSLGTILPVAITSASVSFEYLGVEFVAPFGGPALTEPGAVDIYAQVVPEPGTLALLGVGLAVLRLRKRASR